jgi:predicted nuclease of predicted toxin-antitoxin system
MRIVIDCCLPNEWKEILDSSAHEAALRRDIGPSDPTDEAIMKWAAANDAIVLTQDRDFGELLATQGLTAPSIVQIRDESPTPEDLGSEVLAALQNYTAELGEGAIVTIQAGRARISLLPLS